MSNCRVARGFLVYMYLHAVTLPKDIAREVEQVVYIGDGGIVEDDIERWNFGNMDE